MAGDRLVDVPLTALLRGAWRTYAETVRRIMVEAGFDDLPRNGADVVGAIAGSDLPLGQVVTLLGVSKQAGGQLVDTLVARGYLDRSVDPTDRRRLTVSLTPRGREAADAVRRAVVRLDREMEVRVGAAALSSARRTLAAVAEAGATPSKP